MESLAICCVIVDLCCDIYFFNDLIYTISIFTNLYAYQLVHVHVVMIALFIGQFSKLLLSCRIVRILPAVEASTEQQYTVYGVVCA